MKLPANPPQEWEDLEQNFSAIENQNLYHGIGAPTMMAPAGSFYFNQATGTVPGRIYFNQAEGFNWTVVI
jgi:hypothetical protein